MKILSISILICIYFLALMIGSCDDFMGNDSDDTDEIPDSTRFKELETPIEGKLLFMAGPSHYETDSTTYMDDLFDFYQLSGTSFEKLNNASLI